MKQIQYILSRTMTSLAMAIFVLTAGAPAYAFAASSHTTTNTEASATIDADSLRIDSGEKARITGTTTDAVSKVRVIITATSSDKVITKSSRVKVKSDSTWSARINKKLKDGAYTVTVYDASKSSSRMKALASSTLQVGIPPVTLKVSSIPLLTGGTAKPGALVPISYLQVINQSNATTSIKGFWVKQNGSARTSSVIGFSSVDDKGLSRASNGGTEGFAAFTNGSAYVPSTAVLAPGERRLFTLKAQLSSMSGSSAGSTLMLNVTGVDAQAAFNASFPITGTTWTLSAY